MSSYIVLGNYTDQGAKAIKGAPGRMVNADKLVQSMGGEIRSIYLTLGQYDFVGIFEFPSDEAMLSFSMRVGAEGNIRFTTLKAFPKEDAIEVIQGLP